MIQTKERIQNFILFFAEMICVIASFYAAGYIWLFVYKDLGRTLMVDQLNDNLFTIIFSYLLLSVVDVGGERFAARGYLEELKSVIKKYFVFACIIAVYELLRRKNELFPRGVYVVTFVLVVASVYICRILIKKILIGHNKGNHAIRMIAVTTKARAARNAHLGKDTADWMRRLDAMILVDADMTGQEIDGVKVAASLDTLTDYIRKEVADEVYVDVDYDNLRKLQPVILELEDMGVSVHVRLDVLDLFDGYEVVFGRIDGNVTATFAHRFYAYKKLFVKRCMDIVGSIIGIVIMGICMLVVAPAIKLDSPGPVFFRQKRVGKGGRYFYIYKFRSMCNDAEEQKKQMTAKNEMQGPMFKVTDDTRITRVGAFLRKTSIDELPQFLNVLKGDMSLVGTRPPTVDEFQQYEGRHKRRLTMKPGITGMWQVYGRDQVTDFEEVVKMDLQYIDNWSLTLDIKLLCLTVAAVFKRTGK